jgi:hypothetical protein
MAEWDEEDALIEAEKAKPAPKAKKAVPKKARK